MTLEETIALEPTTVQPVQVPLWAWLVVAAAMFVIYALTMDNGTLLASGAETVHELFHDARHFVGVPCH